MPSKEQNYKVAALARRWHETLRRIKHPKPLAKSLRLIAVGFIKAAALAKIRDEDTIDVLMEDIAKWGGCSVQVARGHVRTLEAWGFVEKTANASGGRGLRTPYHVFENALIAVTITSRGNPHPDLVADTRDMVMAAINPKENPKEKAKEKAAFSTPPSEPPRGVPRVRDSEPQTACGSASGEPFPIPSQASETATVVRLPKRRTGGNVRTYRGQTGRVLVACAVPATAAIEPEPAISGWGNPDTHNNANPDQVCDDWEGVCTTLAQVQDDFDAKNDPYDWRAWE